MQFMIESIATVHNARTDAVDDGWDAISSEILLHEHMPEACFDGIEGFSHLEIVYVFHKTVGSAPVLGAEHPRENLAWPQVGIYAQRKRARPNFIGCTMVRLVRRQGRSLFVERLDAIDGTPVIDIKPVMREFLPAEEVRQPTWAGELMRGYW
ncbi:MAG TPA: TrmO family methyltransferase [Candidatus Hydrogenedentes bacterium]|nr:TrmO family methyltransferase [Candidatus Hydrogenedentota bacterium]